MTEPRREHLELHPDDDRIPRHHRYRLVRDSPRRGCWIFPFLILAALAIVGSAVPSSAPENRMGDAAGRTLAGAAGAAQGQSSAPHVADRPVRHGGEGLKTRTMRPGGAPQPAVASAASSHPGGTSMPAPTANPRLIEPRFTNGGIGTAIESGIASWYNDPRKAGDYGAAPWWHSGMDPVRVSVCSFPHGVTVCVDGGVLVSDFCRCPGRVLDLSPHAFSQLADLSAGLVVVQVELPTSEALPATSTKGTP